MRFFLNTNYPFMSWRKGGYMFSAIVVGIALVGLILRGGPDWSVDFVGGTMIQLQMDKPTEVGEIRSGLQTAGLESAEIQRFGESNEFLVRVEREQYGDKTVETAVDAIRAGLEGTTVEVRRTGDVGPRVGAELKWGATKAIVFGLIMVLLYVGIRYEFRFAAAGVVALFHDVFITVGILTLMDKEFSLHVVAALLTIAGFSVNDTIIIFDRIREGMRVFRKDAFVRIVDKSINQTLSRTVLTSGLTLLTVASLYIFGGEVIRDFALALLIGVLIGTYSSIFVASAIAVDWKLKAADKSDKKKHKRAPVAA